jgi:O-antigen/teichoic acid export membrane protein
MTGKRTLRQRIIHASLWTIGGHASSQVLRLISNLLTTRLLVPEAFGIMALANTFVLGLALFSDVGLGQSVVRSKRSEDPAFTNTVWTLQALRGCLIWLLCLGLALAVYALAQYGFFAPDSVYAHPVLPIVLGVVSASAVIGGFESTNIAMASRTLNVKKITQIELLSQGGALLIMVVWAYLAQSIWALVAGSVAAATIRTVLSHTIVPGPKSKFQWDKAAAQEVFGFGKWIFLGSIMGFLVTNGDRIILGGLTSATSLGIFSLAAFLIGAIQQIFSKLAGSVAYPTFCEVARNEPEQLKFTYYKIRFPIDLASLFAAGFLFSAGHIIADILYDKRYSGVGSLLEIMSISLLEIRYGIAGQCLLALGHSKIITILTSLRLPVVLLVTPVAYAAYGLEGAAWVTGGNMLITIPLLLMYTHKHQLLIVKKELQTLPILFLGYGVGLLTSALYQTIFA